ncbi:hypothetical protein CORC01_06480 [Colletotrichum orchidophilum]|uniref:T6SS Phospholipase effector Tle1-like catalytic domain-containing protein n=1 Tax=Colletotrichum orchidophilum TaxID=1209926 RepID=A0A1G4BA53_9PEZI|nr:uncharacterized protein CORC01_06480 [Colletotrichum orchidophilum]OHE98283.1 hypothetical protein CORC01_06480 [Colletotrichum orchidophilum]
MASATSEGQPFITQIQLPVPQLPTKKKFADCAHKTAKTTNTKRIIVCCDGTWNNSNKRGGIPTNVARLSSAIAHKCCTGMPQVVYYHRGAGTEESKVAQTLGGVFGKGIVQDIADVYRFVCDNYNPGDEIFIVGFSRGAFTARSVSGLICNLGLLNRVGLSNFGAIFHDYQTFPNWTSPGRFDLDDHLVGFTLTNYERLRRFDRAKRNQAEPLESGDLEVALNQEKKEFFGQMTQCRENKYGPMDLRAMAAKYRLKLEEHQMILTEKQRQFRDSIWQDVWVPTNVKVKAVAVWDTVGSLGWPKMPWEKIRKDRSADELRFASLDVHPNVDHAFHALALDEWRTAFKPTLWGMNGNDHTQLRQVWFPGSHSNVGGGFEDQQIATIALAWMADQLTSVGVEFSTPEMKRVFWTLTPGVKAQEWAKGTISNPGKATSIPDQAYNAIWYPWQKLKGENTVLGTRTPGLYKTDDGKSRLVNPNQLVHPSVRIRYLYDGKGLDDVGEWECAALTKNGFRLEKSTGPLQIEDPYPKHPIASTYETLTGTVSSVHGGHTVDLESHKGHTLVVHQVPFESDLCLLEQAENHWVWTRDDAREGARTLREERIGMWERLFIDINHKLVLRQEREERERAEIKAKKPKEKRSWRQWLTDKAESAKGAAGKVLNNTVVGRFLGPSAKLKPLDYPRDFGYHDFISWQRGDVTKTRQRNPWESRKIGA